MSKKREQIKAVMDYQDKEIYVGVHTMSHACQLLDAGYPPPHFCRSVDEANTHQIHEAYEFLKPYILHMEAHPKKKCPRCGSSIDA